MQDCNILDSLALVKTLDVLMLQTECDEIQ